VTAPAAGRPTEVAARVAAVALAVSVVGSVLLAVVYWRGGNVQLEGLGLFLALTGMGVALIVWGRHLLDDGTAVEHREQLATSASDREAFERSIERDDRPDRRILLRRMLMGSVGALGWLWCSRSARWVHSRPRRRSTHRRGVMACGWSIRTEGPSSSTSSRWVAS